MTNRRHFLQAGALTLSSLGLPNLSFSNDKFKDKSVIFVFLAGGATHYETFTAIDRKSTRLNSSH